MCITMHNIAQTQLSHTSTSLFFAYQMRSFRKQHCILVAGIKKTNFTRRKTCDRRTAWEFGKPRAVHIGPQSLMTLCYPRVKFLDASAARKFYCLEIVAPVMAGVAGALSPAMHFLHVAIVQSLSVLFQVHLHH